MKLINFQPMPQKYIPLLSLIIGHNISLIHLLVKLRNLWLHNSTSPIRINRLRDNGARYLCSWLVRSFGGRVDFGVGFLVGCFVDLAGEDVWDLLALYVVDVAGLAQVLAGDLVGEVGLGEAGVAG